MEITVRPINVSKGMFKFENVIKDLTLNAVASLYKDSSRNRYIGERRQKKTKFFVIGLFLMILSLFINPAILSLEGYDNSF